MRCPRCHREVAERSALCPGCGAPLALREEPAPRKLDEPIAMDRRGAGKPEARPPGVPPPRNAAAPPRNAAEAAPRNAAEAAPRNAAEPAPRVVTDAARGAPARREIAAPIATQERSRWDIGAPGKASAAVSTGPVEMGAPARTASGRGPAGAPERTAAGAGGAREIHLRRPEGWRRAAAWAIDAGPFAVGAIALARSFVRETGAGASAPGLLGFLDLLARERVIVLSVAAAGALALFVYATLSHALAGATLGKRILRLRVVAGDGRRPSLGRSAGRSALAALSAMLLGLGILLALFTRSGRGLHDLLARTWVVEVP